MEKVSSVTSREEELLETVRSFQILCNKYPTKSLNKKMLWKMLGMECHHGIEIYSNQ